jgi:hypothetical protein
VMAAMARTAAANARTNVVLMCFKRIVQSLHDSAGSNGAGAGAAPVPPAPASGVAGPTTSDVRFARTASTRVQI